MDGLPPPLILEILNRLHDSTDLARCRIASKALNDLHREVRSINLQCSFERYTRSRCPQTRSRITPFKTIFMKLVSSSICVDSVAIGVEKPLRAVSYDDLEDEDDDLHLTDVKFVEEWLPKVCQRLRSISISDFWIQSCWRRSGILSLISSYCHDLLKLEIKNAWLSVEGLNPMPSLTSLTLEFIRLDDEDLTKLNESFPSLKTLNLIGVGGLKEPKIHLLNLKTCHWTVSNSPISLTILAPNLIKLKLECVKPKLLLIEAPLLSNFHLSVEKATSFQVQQFPNLKTLYLESADLCSLLKGFPFGKTVKTLKIEASRWAESVEMIKLTLDSVFAIFPNVCSLTFGPVACSDIKMRLCPNNFDIGGGGDVKGLTEVSVYLHVSDVELTLSFIFFMLGRCGGSTGMSLFIHRDVGADMVSDLVWRCRERCPKARWRWGVWKEGMKDEWISGGA